MSLSLVPLTLKDRSRFEFALKAAPAILECPLSMLAWVPHLIWSDLFAYSWTELQGWWCLFAEYADHLFMPLPPLGPNSGEGSLSLGSLQEVLSQVMSFMDTRNTGRQGFI